MAGIAEEALGKEKLWKVIGKRMRQGDKMKGITDQQIPAN
jgi:hypothetical protein